MQVTVIINPVSGRQGPRDQARGRAALADVRLRGRGVEVRTAVTTHAGHALALAREAVDAGADVVAAWGGDGTMNQVASVLAGTGVPLGLIPGGSGNGLARDLGVPLVPERALDVLVDGRTRVIDGGTLDGRWFFNVAGLGLDARVARDFQASGRRGLPAYLARTLAALWRNEPTRCVVPGPDGPVEVDALLVAVANSRQYGNGLLIAPAAALDDGRLDVVVVPRRSLPWVLGRVPWLLAGAIDRVPGVAVSRVEHGVIRGDGPIAYHVDGEPFTGGDTLEIAARPGALHVRVPA